jgi:hypothetical protein
MGKLTKGRVVISPNFKDTMDLAQKVYNKHLADGVSSLLKDMDGDDWAVSGPLIAPSLVLHNQAEELSRRAEELYRQRDASGAKVKSALITSKNLLKGRFSNNPKKLGEWGFEIDDTPPVKKVKPKL